jgi:carnitine-CoA ligase
MVQRDRRSDEPVTDALPASFLAPPLEVHRLAPRMTFADGEVRRDELLGMVHRAASACAAAAPGDVLLAAENRVGTVATWLGAMLAARRVVLLNPEIPSPGVERLLGPLTVSVVSGSDQWLRSHDVAPGAERLPFLAVEKGAPHESCEESLGLRGSTVLTTSGTTGASKLVEWPWSALHHNAANMAMVGRYGQEDTVVTSLPLFHANARLVVLLAGMITGASVCVDRKFSARQFSVTMRAYGATKTSFLGSMAQLALERDQGAPIALERMVVAPCDGGTAAALRRRYGASVAQIYGQTDISILMWNDDVSEASPELGVPLPGWEAAIDGDATTGGELLVRPTMANIAALGYVGDDSLTVSSRRDFWFHTGDLLSRAAGRYSFRGRLKDVIRTRGENVSCGEVEAVLRDVDGIVDVAVVGRSNRLGEEDVIAVVETTARDVATLLGGLDAVCRAQLPPFARPVGLAAMTHLPRTPTLKVAKQEIDLDSLDILAVGDRAGQTRSTT